MPIYEFQADDGSILEIFRKMGKCPKKITRKGIIYNRIFSLPSVVVDLNKPKTIGSLAAKNTERMIKNGDPRIKKKKPNPFWRKDKDKPLDIKGWSKSKIKKYIETGKK